MRPLRRREWRELRRGVVRARSWVARVAKRRCHVVRKIAVMLLAVVVFSVEWVTYDILVVVSTDYDGYMECTYGNQQCLSATC